MELVVHVTMDKPEMQHPRNVARALERLAPDLDERFGALDEPEPHAGVIRDLAGSVVGRWELRR